MKIIKPDNLALLFTPCITGDQCTISVAAMSCFSLDSSADENLRTESELWQTVAAELGEEEPLDMGFPKHRGEFLVYGTAHAATPTRGLQVSVTVAGLMKSLHLSGSRFGTLPDHPLIRNRLPRCGSRGLTPSVVRGTH